MLRELDQRRSDQLTVTLEWDPDTGDVWVRCEDRRTPEDSFAFWVEPRQARHAFLHPFAACSIDRDRIGAAGPPASDDEAPSTRRRRWRGRGRGTPAEPADAPGWSWWMLQLGRVVNVPAATTAQTSSRRWGETGSTLAPLDDARDHVRGPASARLILEYGDYECPFSRQAYRVIQRLERRLQIRFAFRHFPLTRIHPHALAASLAAEAAALQGRYWDMHEILFHRQQALEDEDLRGYAAELALDMTRFERDRASDAVLERIERDMRSGLASGGVRGTPTLFIDGLLYQGSLDADEIAEALAGSRTITG